MTDEVVASGPAVIEQNTSGVVGVLAEALAQHQWRRQDHCTIAYRAYCHCGWTQDVAGSHKTELAMHSAHVASVVAALPNIAVVILPEPDTNDRIQHWNVGDISAAERSGLVWADLEPTVYGHEDARVVAANLLAAARAAEGRA